MRTNTTVPIALRVVAVLFLLIGLGAVVEIAVALTNGSLKVALGVLGFWIAGGLLRGDPTWRRWALAFTWLGLVVAPIVIAVALSGRVPTYYEFFGVRAGAAPPTVVAGFAAAHFAVLGWQLWVLTRPEIRARFGSSQSEARPGSEHRPPNGSFQLPGESL